MERSLTFFLSLLFVFASCGSPEKTIGLYDCELAEKLYETKGWQGSYKSQLYLDSAIRICPEYGKAWREISVPYLKLGDYATWINYLNRAIELSPEMYLDIRGWCKIKFLRDYEGGLEDLLRYDSLITGENKIVGEFNLNIWIGFCKMGMKDSVDALGYFDKAIEGTLAESGENWVGLYDYLYRGILKMELGDCKGALRDFESQIGIYEKLADTYYYKGIALLKLGEKAKAKETLIKARALFQGEGFTVMDPYVEMPWQIYEEDLDKALKMAN